MLLLSTSEDEDIVHMTHYPFLAGKDGIHCTLEKFRSTCDAEGQSIELEPFKGGNKGG